MVYSNKDNSNIIGFDDIVHHSNDLNDLKSTLSKIKLEKSKIGRLTPENIKLNHLECVLRQRIYGLGYCEVHESIDMLTKALECTKEIGFILSKIDYNGPIDKFITMDEKAIILCNLAHFYDPISNFNEALEKFKIIRENTTDNQLYHLTLMNEANTRLNLAVYGVDSFNNCIKSIECSEKAREYFDKNDYRYKQTFQNQTNAISELELYNPYGFGIDNKKVLQKLIDEVETDEIGFNQIRMDLNLIKLGVNDSSELINLYETTKKLRTNIPPEIILYHEFILLEGEILIELSIFEEDLIESIGYLNKSIFILMIIEN